MTNSEREVRMRGKKESGCSQQMEGLWDGGGRGMKRRQRERERDLIFSSVIQSSEVLLLLLRLYDTVMLGSE